MLLETWITDNNDPIPNPIPEEIANREIRISGYAGVANTSYTTGKIEAWIQGKQKFSMQHPLIFGARWAYSDGLWLILIVKKKYHLMQAGFSFSDPVYGGVDPDPWGIRAIGFYFHSYKYYEDITYRQEFYYDAYEPLVWRAYDVDGYPVPSPYSVGSFSINIPLKGHTAESIGAEIIINQLSSHTIYANEKWMNPTWWVESGHITAYSFDSWQVEINDALSSNPAYSGVIWSAKLSDIEAKAKKSRISPFNPNFIEYAIPMVDAPCPIKITVDRTLNRKGDDFFCLEYEDYDKLINRFNNIETKLNELAS